MKDESLTLLLTLLLLLPLTLLFVLSLFRPGYLITVLAWMMFGLLSVWVGSKLEYILHPERLAYQRIIEACNQIIREVAEETGALFVDNDAALGADEAYFVDYIHYTCDGVRKVAEDYAAVIMSSGLLDGQ